MEYKKAPSAGALSSALDSDGCESPMTSTPISVSTMIILCLMAVIKGADLQLLPSSFRAMEVDLNLKPYYLGILSLCQGLACSCSGPFWGNLVDCGFPRTYLLMIGVTLWGVCTIMLGMVPHFTGMAVLRALNGVALACLLPITQSFVAELADRNNRGSFFGWLYLFSNMGQVFACLFVTPLSNETVMGIAGWRLALLVVGCVTLLSVPLIPILVVEKPQRWRPDRFGLSCEVNKLYKFVHIRTFLVILLQGVFGTIPGAALSFVTMYLQYTGVSDSIAAMINALHIVGSALGGLLGGSIGDMLHAKSPSYGRALTAQLSMLGCIPCVFIMFHLLAPTQENVGEIAGMLFVLGLIGSWVAPGCLCPVMCDIVARRYLASAYAWELAIVFASGNALGPITVGYLSQTVYGYRVSDDQVIDMNPAFRTRNAEALGQSLLFACIVPYTICTVLFTLMYFTYRGDCRDATTEDLSEESDSAAIAEPHESTHLLNIRGGAAARRAGPVY